MCCLFLKKCGWLANFLTCFQLNFPALHLLRQQPQQQPQQQQRRQQQLRSHRRQPRPETAAAAAAAPEAEGQESSLQRVSAGKKLNKYSPIYRARKYFCILGHFRSAMTGAKGFAGGGRRREEEEEEEETPRCCSGRGRGKSGEEFAICLLVCLLTALYQGPNFVHKMLVLKDVAVFRLPGVLYGWILQSGLMLPCDLQWPLAER